MTRLMALTNGSVGVPSCGKSGVGRRASGVGRRASGVELYGVACRTVQMPMYGRITKLKLRICLKQKESVYGEVTCKYGARQQSTK